jgi:DNA-binding CsgD family transcriptional regulator
LELNKTLSWEYSTHVNEICKELFDSFGMNYFDYARFYPDSSCVLLFSDKGWVNHFLKEQNYIPPPKLLAPGCHLWDSYIDSSILKVAEDGFNHTHGITFTFQKENYHEVINFSAPSDNKVVQSIYLNRINFLKRFIYYFKERAADLIVSLEKDKLSLGPNEIAPSTQSLATLDAMYNEFVRAIGEDKFCDFRLALNAFTEENHLQALTLRESECVMGLLAGKSAKVMGRELNISYRTVENHLEKIKQKLNVKTRLELLSKLSSELI